MMTTTLKKIALALACAGALLMSARTASATTLTFDVLVNTSPLMGNPPGSPFFLDFQLTGVHGNSALINNFQYAGGSALGNSPLTVGNASGSLGSGVTLNDSGSFFNELYQTFTAGTSLRFSVTVFTNPGPDPAPGNLSPDAFSFAILDSSQQNIVTTGPGDTLFLYSFDLRSNPFRTVPQGFSGTGAFAAINAQAVPEPGTITLLAIGLAGIALAIRTRRSVASF